MTPTEHLIALSALLAALEATSAQQAETIATQVQQLAQAEADRTVQVNDLTSAHLNEVAALNGANASALAAVANERDAAVMRYNSATVQIGSQDDRDQLAAQIVARTAERDTALAEVTRLNAAIDAAQNG